MKRPSPSYLKALAIALGLLIAYLLAWEGPPWLYRQRFNWLARRHTPLSAIDCGRIPFRRSHTAQELACARSALQRKSPFRLVLQGGFGIDSYGADALLYQPGASHIVSLRYVISGYGFRLQHGPCPDPRFTFTRDAVFITCTSDRL